MQLTRRSFAKAAGAVSLSALLGPQFAMADAAAEPTFVFPINYMPSSLQYSTASDDQVMVTRPVFDVLYASTIDGLEYYLCTDLTVSEDGLTYTMTLAEDACWSDGEPITVDDVTFTIEYGSLRSGGVSSYNAINGQMIQFNKLSDKVLEMVLPEPYDYFIYTFTRLTPIPAHCFGNDPTTVDGSGFFNTLDMVCSGPYTVSEWNEDSIVYVARDDYYRGTPQVRKIVMRTIGGGSTRQIALENGEISYMRVTTADLLAKYEADPAYNVYSVSEARLNYLQFNPWGPAGLDEDARKAICLAINLDEVLDIAYGTDKLVAPANSIITPDQVLYDPACVNYQQDLQTAAALAESCGLKGKTLTYVYNADRANMEEVAVVVQQQLAQIGVNLQVEGLDSTTFFQRFFGKMYGTGQESTWDLGTNGWDSERGESLGQAFTYLVNRYEAWGWSADISAEALAVNSTVDADERKTMAAQLQADALVEYWMYPLTYTNYIMVSPANVTGLDGSSIVPEFIDYTKINVA